MKLTNEEALAVLETARQLLLDDATGAGVSGADVRADRLKETAEKLEAVKQLLAGKETA